MATVLSHHQQAQHQHHQQLLYPIQHHHQFNHLHHNHISINHSSESTNTQNNTNSSSTTIINNTAHQQHHNHTHHQQQQLQGASPAPVALVEHFCKDCGVMFESSTSLEVHLSYHKENLLTRWATQETLDKSGSSVSSCGSSNLNPSSPSPRGDHHQPLQPHQHHQQQRERSDSLNNNSVNPPLNSSSGQEQQPGEFYSPMEGQYLPPQYNNNTGDHLMESYRPGSGPGFGQPPVAPEPHSHQQQSNGSNLAFESFHYHPHPPLGAHPLFSPGHPAPPGSGGNEPGGNGPSSNNPPPPQSGRESAEILDLDSHKVHIYQHQQQQLAERSFFHRPYLPHLSPAHQQQPLPPMNGWPGEPHHFGTRFTLSPAGYPVDHHPGFYGQPPPPPVTTAAANNSPNSYEIIKVENNFAGYGGEPLGYDGGRLPLMPPSHMQPNGNGPFVGIGQPPPQQLPSPYSHATAMQQQGPQGVGIKSESSSSSSSVLSPGGLTSQGQQRSPTESQGRTGGRGQGNGNSGGQGTTGKTKGWKGGECKRPKTYNCPACNKWFTSSGHLKRHYGTTLHKNSVKQLGDNAEEIIKPSPKGKKAKLQLQQQQQNAEQQQPPPSRSQIRRSSPKSEDTSSNGGQNTPLYQTAGMDALNQLNNNNGILAAEMAKPPSSAFSLNLNPPVPISSPNFAPATTVHSSLPGGIYNPYSIPPPSSLPFLANPMALSHPTLHPQHQHQSLNEQPPPPPQQSPFSTNGFSIDLVPIANPLYNNSGSSNGGGVVSNGTVYEHPPHCSNSNADDNNGTPKGHLPPFSSVGLSHYEAHGHPTGGGPIGNNPMEFQPNSNKMTPPYHPLMPQQQQQPHHPPHLNSTPSPNNSTGGMNSSGGLLHENSFDSERGEQPQPNLLRESPTETRSDSGSAGSTEGSLDELDNSESDGGSPTSSNSDGASISVPLTENSNGGGPAISGGDREVLKCPDCSKTFGRACYLTQHTNSSHSVSGKPFKCQTCGKRFPEAPALSDHIAKHGSDKPYKCDLCPKQFNHKTDLRRHMCLHTGEKPFMCDLCGKGFIRKDHMTKHWETHRKKNHPNTNNSSNNNNNNNSATPAST